MCEVRPRTGEHPLIYLSQICLRVQSFHLDVDLVSRTYHMDPYLISDIAAF